MTQFQRQIKDFFFFFSLLEANEQIALLCSVERVKGEIYRVVFIKDLFGSILIWGGENLTFYQKYSPLFAASSGIKILYGIKVFLSVSIFSRPDRPRWWGAAGTAHQDNLNLTFLKLSPLTLHIMSGMMCSGKCP